ncbi:hypothetical protein WS68_10890 [Burkholderia sp. TSV86]|nr:hypothetical protein WS68_10890 [Burkholderia sp. TSV86]
MAFAAARFRPGRGRVGQADKLARGLPRRRRVAAERTGEFFAIMKPIAARSRRLGILARAGNRQQAAGSRQQAGRLPPTAAFAGPRKGVQVNRRPAQTFYNDGCPTT